MKLLRQIAIQFGVTFVALALLFTLGAPALQRFEGHPAIQKAIYTLGFAGEAYAITPDYEVDGNADDVQVQQALNALPVTGGKLVLYAGNWHFNATVSRAINNVTIEGDGKGTYIVNNAVTALFSAGAQTGWVFKDFRTDAGWLTVAADTRFEGSLWDDTALVTGQGRSATIVIAPANAPKSAKAGADYILTGTADQTIINAAFAVSTSQVWLEGDISLTDEIVIPALTSVSIRGAGRGRTRINQTTAGKSVFAARRVVGDGYAIDISGLTTKTAAIADTTNNQTATDTTISLSSDAGHWQRGGERFTNFPIGTITGIQFKLLKSGAPTGYGYVRVYGVTDNKSLGVLGAVDVATLGGAAAWVTFNTGSAFNGSVQDIRVVFEYSGGNAGNNVQMCFNSASVYAGGVATILHSDWTDTAADATWQNLTYKTGTGFSFDLREVHHSKFSNIGVYGSGSYGFYLQGCILNTFDTITVSPNTEPIGTWVPFIEGFHLVPDYAAPVYCNANTFINLILEGHSDSRVGMYVAEQGVTGSYQSGNSAVYGGTMEGFTTYGLMLTSVWGFQLYNTYFEANTIKDIWATGLHSSILQPGEAYFTVLISTDYTRLEGICGTLTEVSTSNMSKDAALR